MFSSVSLSENIELSMAIIVGKLVDLLLKLLLETPVALSLLVLEDELDSLMLEWLFLMLLFDRIALVGTLIALRAIL
jgi:hypothetical protein